MLRLAIAAPKLPVEPTCFRNAQSWPLPHAIATVVAIALLKCALLLLDPQVRLFTGDSGTYLFSAVTHGLPTDRSFTYPLLIRMVTSASNSLVPLLLLQTGFGIATATGVVLILRVGLGVRPWLAVSAGLLVAIEPSQLFYERMVMTEAASTFSLVALACFALLYLRSGKLAWLLACIVAGVVLASLRVGMVPVALSMPTAAVLVLALARGDDVPRLGARRLAVHLLAAILVTWACHDAYKRLYGHGCRSAPAYIQDAGIFRLGLVAPLLKPAHFDGTGIDASLLDRVMLPLSDPFLREAHIWRPGGLIAVLRAQAGPRTREVAATLADRAIHDDPVGLLRMGLATFKDYFDAPKRAGRMRSDLGIEELPNERTMQLLRDRYHYDYASVASAGSPVFTYFGYSSWWLMACLFLLAPLAVAMLLLERHWRPAQGLLLATLALGLVVGQLLCSHIVSFRYLHPLPILFLAFLAATVDRMLARGGSALVAARQNC